MRRSVLLVCVLVGCAPARKSSAPPVAPMENSAAAALPAAGAHAPSSIAAPVPKCWFAVRRLSAYGRGALRPQIAATNDAFAVAWEETTDHRSIRVETFAADSRPLGPSIEVADISRAAAAPRLAAAVDNDGFVVFWSTEREVATAIMMRRIDRAGKPKSDAMPVVLAPGARALDAVAGDGGYALAWWNWSGTPHQLAVTFVSNDGRVAGKPLSLTRAPPPDPTVDLARGATTMIAWDETVGDGEHVFVAAPSRARLDGRTDLGPGSNPRFGAGVLVWERASEATIWSAPLAGGVAPVRLTDGHMPAAAARDAHTTALCYLRDTDPSEAGHVDELTCGDLVDGKLVDSTRLAVDPKPILGLSVAAAAGRIGVAWQTQEADDTGISFASLSCPDPAAVAKARE